MNRRYCGHSAGSRSSSILKTSKQVGRGHPEQRKARPSDLQSLTSSSRQSLYPTQFVKLANPKNKAALGLGHSQSELARNFSRRNSATTTLSHCSSCCSSYVSAPQQRQRENRVKVLSWDTGAQGRNDDYQNDSYCEYTDNRRLYEQRVRAVNRMETQGQVQCQSESSGSGTPLSSANPTLSSNDDLQQLLLLQQFRLLNASECFSVQRQDELRLQNAYEKLFEGADAKREKNRANECRQQFATSTTPYALRQKLLQMQLHQEQASGRGTGAFCAPLEPSCALKYN